MTASSCFLDVFHVKARRHKGRKKIRDCSLLSDPCGAVGSSARLPLDRGCIARLPAVARGRRQWTDRVRWQGAGRAEITGSREAAKSL